MTTFLETLINGLAVGSLYALIALGYTMVYGILKFINFAHSDIFVVGAWASLVMALGAGWTSDTRPEPAAWIVFVVVTLAGLAALSGLLRSPAARRVIPARLDATFEKFGSDVWPLAGGLAVGALALFYAARMAKSAGAELLSGAIILIAAMVVCGLLGLLIERFAYKPLRRSPRLNVLITAIGVSLFLQNAGQMSWVFGASPKRMPELLPDRVLVTVQNVQIRLVDVIGAGTAVLLMIGLEWLVFRTRLGRAMRAVSFSHSTAALMGVNVDRVISFTFVLGSMLAAAAGFLYALKYPGVNQPAYSTWVLLGLKAFVAAVVGGIGNIRGAMLGGIFIGLIEFFGVAYTGSILARIAQTLGAAADTLPAWQSLGTSLRDVYVFALLILVLLVRPSGLLGRASVEKV